MAMLVSTTQNVTFTTLTEVTGLTSDAGMWHTLNFTASSARYVRVYVTKTRESGGTFRAQIAEIEVFETLAPTGVDLTWTAPGDDGATGTATSYDIRYSTSSITSEAEFDAASVVPGSPTPQPGGTSETFTVTSLPSGTYYFAIKAEDDAGNIGAVSNSPSATWP
jgi:hypothetical protein